MRQVHFTLYGKGGVGKSLVASFIAQYLSFQGETVDVINSDYLMKERNFDRLFNHLLEVDANFVVDSGPTSFIPLRHYILESDAINLLAQYGKQVVMHVVITRDTDTHINFLSLLEQMPTTAKVVVWLNEFYGKIEAFEQTDVYLKNAHRVHGIVRLATKLSEVLYSADIERMLAAKLTFDEVNTSPDFSVIARHRLNRVREGIYQQLGAIT